MGKLAVGIAVGVAVATSGIAAVMVAKRVSSRRKWRKVVRVLEELEECCSTSVERLRQVVDAMAVEMHAGLASEGGSKLKMLLTFIHNLPNGYNYLHISLFFICVCVCVSNLLIGCVFSHWKIMIILSLLSDNVCLIDCWLFVFNLEF